MFALQNYVVQMELFLSIYFRKNLDNLERSLINVRSIFVYQRKRKEKEKHKGS